MAVVSHELKLIYFDVPKVACTTLKTQLYELAHGPLVAPFQPTLKDRARAALGRPRPRHKGPSVHYRDGYRTFSYTRALREQDLPSDYARIAVVRDPIARFYSAWANKANEADFARRDELEDLRNEGLSTAPDFQQYLEAFEVYRTHSRPVRVHNQPYSWHLGPSASDFDKIFQIEDMSRLEAWLCERHGEPITLKKSNLSERKQKAVALEDSQKAKLLALTHEDYRWLGDLYDAQAGLEGLTG
ncbi:MAG: sulfotransferase family 2 domain-containing protein [Pseudomonadota bacterium]